MVSSPTTAGIDAIAARYLDLLKRSLSGTLHADPARAVLQADGGIEYVAMPPSERPQLEEGRSWPAFGETMIGLSRLDNLRFCVEELLRHEIPGDFIEAGVWRGGASIYTKALLELHGATDRSIWLADSFAGLPAPHPDYPSDAGATYHTIPFLAVSPEQVVANFQRYNLHDDRVRLVKGFFKDTLPTLAGKTWALVRLDGDMYESTMDGLVHLYPGLSPDGYIIIDDFGCCPPCRQAVEDFRALRGIEDPIRPIDWTGVFWRKGERMG